MITTSRPHLCQLLALLSMALSLTLAIPAPVVRAQDRSHDPVLDTALYRRHELNAIRAAVTGRPEILDGLRTVAVLVNCGTDLPPAELNALMGMVVEARRRSRQGPAESSPQRYLRRFDELLVEHRDPNEARRAFVTAMGTRMGGRGAPSIEEVQTWFPQGIRLGQPAARRNPQRTELAKQIQDRTPLRLPTVPRVEALLASNGWYATEKLTPVLLENDHLVREWFHAQADPQRRAASTKRFLAHVDAYRKSTRQDLESPKAAGRTNEESRVLEDVAARETRRQQAIEAYQARQQEMSAFLDSSVAVISQLAETLNQPDLRFAAHRLSRALAITKEFEKLVSAETLSELGAAAVTMNYMVLGMQVIQLFSGGSGGVTNEDVLRYLQQLGQEMHKRFDRLEWQVASMGSAVMEALQGMHLMLGRISESQGTLEDALINLQLRANDIQESIDKRRAEVYLMARDETELGFKRFEAALLSNPRAYGRLLVVEATDASRRSLYLGPPPCLMVLDRGELDAPLLREASFDELGMTLDVVRMDPGSSLDSLLRLESILYGLPATPSSGRRVPSATLWKRETGKYLNLLEAPGQPRAIPDDGPSRLEELEQLTDAGLDLQSALETGRDLERIAELVTLRQFAWDAYVASVESAWHDTRRRELLGQRDGFAGFSDELAEIQSAVLWPDTGDQKRLAALDQLFPTGLVADQIEAEGKLDRVTSVRPSKGATAEIAIPNEQVKMEVGLGELTISEAVPDRLKSLLSPAARAWIGLRYRHRNKGLPPTNLTFVVVRRLVYQDSRKQRRMMFVYAVPRFDVECRIAYGSQNPLSLVCGGVLGTDQTSFFSPVWPQDPRGTLVAGVPGPVPPTSQQYWTDSWNHLIVHGNGTQDRSITLSADQTISGLIHQDVLALRGKFLAELVDAIGDPTGINSGRKLLAAEHAWLVRANYRRLQARDRLLRRHLLVFAPDLQDALQGELDELPAPESVAGLLDETKSTMTSSRMRDVIERLKARSAAHATLARRIRDSKPLALRDHRETSWSSDPPGGPAPTTLQTIGRLTNLYFEALSDR